MVLSVSETKTILAALKYLAANRDDVLDALSDEDDATGEVVRPNLLTVEQISDLNDRIVNGVLTLTEEVVT